MKSCRACAHYREIDEQQGACRRHPPQLSAPNMSQFPTVKAGWECGEFERSLKAGKTAKIVAFRGNRNQVNV